MVQMTKAESTSEMAVNYQTTGRNNPETVFINLSLYLTDLMQWQSVSVEIMRIMNHNII
jgi:hypothetical protein